MSKTPVSVSLDAEVAEECRNAAWWVGQGWTLSRILEEGAEAEVSRLERTHGKFPQRDEEAALTRKPGRSHGKSGERKPARKPVVLRMDTELLDNLRNAAAALSVNITSIVEDGAVKVLARLRKTHNGGNSFTDRQGDLPHA